MQALGRRAFRESFGARLGWEGFEGERLGAGLGEGLRGKQRSRPPAADSVCKDLWSEPFARCRCGVERRASGARCPMQMLWTRFLEGSLSFTRTGKCG